MASTPEPSTTAQAVPLQEAPNTASLADCALAAIAERVPADSEASDETALQYLFQARQRIHGTYPDWKAALEVCLQKPADNDSALVNLGKALGLTPIELLAAALASVVEADLTVGRALARVQAPLGGSRPTLGLLAAAFAGLDRKERPLKLLVNGRAVQTGLLTVRNQDSPVPERSIEMPLHLHLALHGADGTWPGMTIGLGEHLDVPLSQSIEVDIHSYARGLEGWSRRTLVVRTASPSEGRSVCCEIARRLNKRALFIETENIVGLGPWLLLRDLIPVFCFELAPGERKQLPSTPGYRGPAMVLCGPDGTVATQGEPALSWLVPTPTKTERQDLWHLALGDERLGIQLAQSHRQGCGRIAQLGRLARRQGVLRGRSTPVFEDVVEAAWTGEGPGLDTLAQPMKESIPDNALVASERLRNDLRTLELRCRSREDLATGRGASLAARYRSGVRALFVGPSGTGKTLAAGWLATRLGLPLYQVDLASVNSKYIGETEKNLAQLLARAEHAEVILLFDEADSLFGKRTEVRDSTDRFANSQTNYLLQRIETFDGIAILTSNSRARFDSAFTRRLDMIVEFSAPGPEERRELWRSHLGANHQLTTANLNQLASAADVCGGQIRNAVLTGAVLALEDRRPIAFRDLVEGLSSEYRKLGKQLPQSLSQQV